ncbi:MAG TPA: hypothetical protein VH497_12035 [Vicinamibacterales bacterium]
MMKLLGTVLAVAITAGGQAPAKPNFSGEWKFNPAKSDFGVLPPPSSIRRTITHTEPNLTIVEDQRSDMGDASTTRKYVTDGTPITFASQGFDVKSSATWDGAALVIVSKVESQGLTFKDDMTLSPDGRMLVSSVHISSLQGDLDIVIAFDKQ